VISESNFQPDYDEEEGDEDSDNESVDPEDSASQAGTASQVGEGRTNIRLEILNKVLVQHGVVRTEAEDSAVTDPHMLTLMVDSGWSYTTWESNTHLIASIW